MNNKNLAIIEYINQNRYKTYTSEVVEENFSPENAGLSIKNMNIHVLVFVIPFYIRENQARKILKTIVCKTSVKDFIISNPSNLCLYAFCIESFFYININIIDKDDVYSVGCDSGIKKASDRIELDEMQKSILYDSYKFECYVEVAQKRLLCESLCDRFEGYLDVIINDVYSLLSRLDSRKELANCIHVSSRCKKLKSVFEDKFTMKNCMDECDNIGKIKILNIPSFIKDTSFIWETVNNNLAFIGALKAFKENVLLNSVQNL